MEVSLLSLNCCKMPRQPHDKATLTCFCPILVSGVRELRAVVVWLPPTGQLMDTKQLLIETWAKVLLGNLGCFNGGKFMA